MIRAVFFKTSSGDYQGFQISGHAGYAKAGRDIVCAAVSALALNTVNSIENLTDDAISAEVGEDGFLKMTFSEKPGAGSALLMDSLILGLTSIAEENNKSYIHLDFKEV